MRKLLLVSLVIMLLVSGCGPAAGTTPMAVPGRPTPIPTQTPVPATDEEAIEQLMRAEGEAVVQQDIDRLEFIWALDGVVTDANHTPDDPKDDIVWSGWDAIRDRYVNEVFPSYPMEASPMDIQITIEGDTATATSTTHIGPEISPGGDRWTFAKREGLWKITSLTYNLEAR